MVSVSNAYLDVIDNGYAQSPSISKLFDFVVTNIEFDVECAAPLAVELHSDSGLIENAKFEFTEGGKKHMPNLNIHIGAGIPLRIFINGSNVVKPKIKMGIKTAM